MGFRDTFPPLETALTLEPEELGPFVLRHLESMGQGNINRYNYTLGSSPELIEYAGDRRKEFLQCLMEAWMWLEHEQFLVPRPGTQGEWMIISRRGFRVLKDQNFATYAKGSLLPSDALDPILVRKVRPLFLSGDYDTAVFRSFKEVEIRVRTRAGLGSAMLGVTLMRQAFSSPNGPLTSRNTEAGEQVATMDLFAGAIGRFKNPSSHRSVDYTDPQEVADIIHLANQLLRMLDAVPGPERATDIR